MLEKENGATATVIVLKTTIVSEMAQIPLITRSLLTQKSTLFYRVVVFNKSIKVGVLGFLRLDQFIGVDNADFF